VQRDYAFIEMDSTKATTDALSGLNNSSKRTVRGHRLHIQRQRCLCVLNYGGGGHSTRCPRFISVKAKADKAKADKAKAVKAKADKAKAVKAKASSSASGGRKRCTLFRSFIYPKGGVAE
jgi:hypothetical protein